MNKYILYAICIIVIMALLVFGVRRGCYGRSHEAPDIPDDEVNVRLY